MGSEVHLHHPAKDVAALKLFEYLGEGGGIARQHRGLGLVLTAMETRSS